MRSRSSSDPEQVLAFAIELARTVHDSKCTDVTLLDVRGRRPETDFILIASGTSQRQMRSTAQGCEDLGKAQGNAPYRNSADTGTTWVVVDFVEVVVHLFEPEQRMYYDLELLYTGSKRIRWQRVNDAETRGSPTVGRSGEQAESQDASA